MKILHYFSIFFVGISFKHVMTYNPLLTYTIRFKKIILFPNITGDFILNQYNGLHYVNAIIEIPSWESLTKVIVLFDRCNPEGNDCEYFQSWTLLDICTKLKDKNQIWSQWYQSFHPPVICPLNKGQYVLKNGTFDINQVIRWYSDAVNYRWKVTQKFYADDLYLGAYLIEASTLSYRKDRKPKFS